MTARSAGRPARGGQLRTAILDAASAILEETGSDDALTLRAIARRAGVTAPAIYGHFADREEIRREVVTGTFAELAAVLASAAAGAPPEPAAALRHVCLAYLDFAADRPHHYRVLFERHRVSDGTERRAADVTEIPGADAFGVLLAVTTACIERGPAPDRDATLATTRVWIGLHGQATLQASLPWFPWPDRAALAEDIASRLTGADIAGRDTPEPD